MNDAPRSRAATPLAVGAWILIACGITHLLAYVAGKYTGPQDEREAALHATLAAYVLPFPPFHPTFAKLVDGFSLFLSLGLVAYGSLLRLLARWRSSDGPLLRSAAWLAIVFSGGCIAIGLYAFPLPPVGFFVAALAAFVVAVRRS